MSAAQKRERPEAVAAAKGPDIRIVHSKGNSDMNSVAQSQKPPTFLDDVAMELHDVMLIAKRGGVLCDALMTDDG